jgi:hypothetical protein
MTLDFSALSALVAGLLPVPFERLSGNKEKREAKKKIKKNCGLKARDLAQCRTLVGCNNATGPPRFPRLNQPIRHMHQRSNRCCL